MAENISSRGRLTSERYVSEAIRIEALSMLSGFGLPTTPQYALSGSKGASHLSHAWRPAADALWCETGDSICVMSIRRERYFTLRNAAADSWRQISTGFTTLHDAGSRNEQVVTNRAISGLLALGLIERAERPLDVHEDEDEPAPDHHTLIADTKGLRLPSLGRCAFELAKFHTAQ